LPAVSVSVGAGGETGALRVGWVLGAQAASSAALRMKTVERRMVLFIGILQAGYYIRTRRRQSTGFTGCMSLRGTEAAAIFGGGGDESISRNHLYVDRISCACVF
jgi:hypothetical protein